MKKKSTGACTPFMYVQYDRINSTHITFFIFCFLVSDRGKVGDEGDMDPIWEMSELAENVECLDTGDMFTFRLLALSVGVALATGELKLASAGTGSVSEE